MLVPHGGKYAELGKARLAADEGEDSRVLIGLEPVLGHHGGGNAGALRGGAALPPGGRSSAHAASSRLSNSAAAVGTAVQRLDHVLRMRHHADHVAGLVDDAGDVAPGPVGVGALGIAKYHAPLAFDPAQRLVVTDIVALAVGDGTAIEITLAGAAGEKRP